MNKNNYQIQERKIYCPLCKEGILNMNELYECMCKYNICEYCFEDILEYDDGVCEKCHNEIVKMRKRIPSYRESYSYYINEIQGSDAKNKSQHTKSSTKSDLSQIRIIQKNLVYIIGLSSDMANEEILKKYEYLSQYGKINKIVVNKNSSFNQNGVSGPQYSAYITYAQESQAALAILALDEYQMNDKVIRASYGTTKYCSYFIKEIQCNNSDCLYQHTIAKPDETFTKDDILSTKNIFNDQQKLAFQYIKKYRTDLQKIKFKNQETVFPNIKQVVSKILNKYDDAEKRVVRPVEKDKVTRSTGKVINTVSEDVLLETNDTKFEQSQKQSWSSNKKDQENISIIMQSPVKINNFDNVYNLKNMNQHTDQKKSMNHYLQDNSDPPLLTLQKMQSDKIKSISIQQPQLRKTESTNEFQNFDKLILKTPDIQKTQKNNSEQSLDWNFNLDLNNSFDKKIINNCMSENFEKVRQSRFQFAHNQNSTENILNLSVQALIKSFFDKSNRKFSEFMVESDFISLNKKRNNSAIYEEENKFFKNDYSQILNSLTDENQSKINIKNNRFPSFE